MSIKDQILRAALLDKNMLDEASKSEKIYEPKYGGKDHSGYDTMMKYEINYERMEAFDNGAIWQHTQDMKLIELLATELERCVEAMRIGAFHHNACASNFYDDNNPDPEWIGSGEHRFANKCTCAHIKVAQALTATKRAIGEITKQGDSK